MTGLTWLHLSDWHQAEKKFNRKVVCDGLINDIKARGEINPHLSKIDFIVFSGDAANSGQPDEYSKATVDLFEPLLEACQLGKDRLFIVPGNHDLDRDLIPAALSKPLNSNEEVEPWWSEEKKRTQLSQPFQAFHRFLTDCTGQKPPEYCSFASFVIDDRKIALLGINSAWMCARRKDEVGKISDQGYLCIGEPQIYDSLKMVSDSEIKIAILHHPLDWLTPFDSSRNEVHLKRKCNFILHGHAHKPGASAIRDNFGYYITIPAGACYDRSMPSNSDYTYSYNYVHLDFDADKGVVFLRRWSDLNRIWRKDDETFPPNGQFHFSISGSDKPPIPHQIPPPPRDFKGREEEIADILSKFEKGATITGLRGMGGIGKTALALVLADRIKSQFPDGQIFVDMRGTSNNPELPPLTPSEAMAQVIRAYNPVDRLPENSNELRGLYLSVLAAKHALLLLDNAAGSEQVESLLPPAGCAVLITSRIKFACPGLVEKDLDILPKDKACELLLQIAPRIGDWADELARLCGYLPFTLRNAAGALAERRDLSVPEYQRRLKDKAELLKLVKGSFSLSYDLLTPGRKKQWRRLSVFPEDFDRSAATAVLKMAPGASAEALGDLVQWSLVNFAATPDSEEGRYKLHDLARLFAESCLEQDELTDARQKHAKHYSDVLSRAENLYKNGGTDLLAGLKLFDREWANIKVGQAWAKNIIPVSSKLKKSDSKSVLQLAGSYAGVGGDILNLRMHPHEKIVWMETGLKAARVMKDQGNEGVHLGNLGQAYAELGETRKAIGYLVRALNISRKVGNRSGECAHLGNLGLAHGVLGETRKAIEYHEQALKIYREIGDRRGEGNALGNLGLAYAGLGETRKAIEYHEQALTISREIGDRSGEGEYLCNLAKAYLDLNETERAIEYCMKSLDIVRKIEYKKLDGEALSTLAKAYSNLGQIDKAIDHCDQALKIFKNMEYRRGEGEALFTKGQALHKLDRRTEAAALAAEALQIFVQIESPLAEKVRQKLAEWGCDPVRN